MNPGPARDELNSPSSDSASFSKEAPLALIIGAGPAGLTAAFELLERTNFRVLVLEESHEIGGLSRTIRYKGNRIDIGGHRFFSKSDRVMDWWLERMPLDANAPEEATLSYHNQHRALPILSTEERASGPNENVMLLRPRRTRVYFRRRFFAYPISLSPDTLKKLGFRRTIRIGTSYLQSALRPIRPEQTLEQFFINRFGRELYRTFFRSYTEKVWGVPCRQISAEWGAQRIKGLSLRKAIAHFAAQLLRKKATTDAPDIAQKQTETSLIERFLYPKLGPGQMWELVADQIQERGGTIESGWRVEGMVAQRERIVAVQARHDDGSTRRFEADIVFSTMPVQNLVSGLTDEDGLSVVPPEVQRISDGLVYRDFITVGLLLDKMKIRDAGARCVADTWIYIQESDVQLGRLQVFNNWSPHLLADPDTVWIGLEYFCNEGDALWNLSDEEMKTLAVREVAKIGLVDAADVRDATVVRVPKTYPAYFGTYDEFPTLRAWLDGFSNLYLIGRNGMHRYNNQDHSILTAMTAVDNIVAGRTDKGNIWDVNTEQEYHEARSE